MNVKGLDYTCVIQNMTRNDTINILNNYEVDDKGSL